LRVIRGTRTVAFRYLPLVPVVTPPATPLVGRSTELAALTAGLDAAARGRGSVHFVIGEGGVGKTHLVMALAEVGAAKGFARVVGRAYAVETGIPYALFADGFLPVLRGLPPATLQVLARGSIAELVTLFPALRGEGLAAAEIDEDEVKPRLLDAFSRFVHKLAQREPHLIVLENLHSADPSSFELLQIVAPGQLAEPSADRPVGRSCCATGAP
jgi:predicted ATPase